MNMEIYDEICSPALPQTGRGVSIAVIELPARRDHPLFASNIKSFVPSPRSSIHPVSPQYHPTTTLACMVGHYEGYHRIGLAPDADVHLYETNFFKPEFFNGQETSEEQREGKSEIKALLREEILHQ